MDTYIQRPADVYNPDAYTSSAYETPNVDIYNTLAVGLESIVVGALAAVTILYGFQTRTRYPDAVLRILDHPWILGLSGVIALIVFKWSPAASVLLLLLLTAFCVDTMAFAKPLPQLHSDHDHDHDHYHENDHYHDTPAERLSNESAASAAPYDERVLVRIPGVGVTAADAGVALSISSVALPVPRYPLFSNLNSSERFSEVAFPPALRKI